MDELLAALPAPLPPVKRVIPLNKPNKRFVVGRAGGVLPTSIIIHSTVSPGPRSSSLEWLSTSPASAVSCHTLANRDGSLTEIIPPMWTAYHAGYTLPGFNNTHSLGIEIENSSDGGRRVESYPLVQIISAAYRVATWQFSFGIPAAMVQSHRAVAVFGPDSPQAGQLGRKFDPLNFPADIFDDYRERWLDFLQALPAEWHEAFII